MDFDEKEQRKHEIEREIELINIQIRSKKFDRYSDTEKLLYIEIQLNLFKELKGLYGFIDRFKINTLIVALENIKKRLVK